MAQIPFSPPQTQAALQNPVRFPDQRLQEYARGQQPTGQVTPQMAQQEMMARGNERQAFQRQQAMQNNPANSPTIFQQKDMELQQKAQQLAAMGQQIQQKEQQLGLLGALMAKKEQDLAGREQGIATLPMRPDMFTAMDGGIVFSGGGGVKGYAGPDGLSLVRGNIDDEARALDQLRVDRILGERKRKEDLERLEFLERVAPEAAEKMLRDNPSLRPSAPSTIESNAPSTTKDDRRGSDKEGVTTTGPAGRGTPSAPGIASLAGGSSFTTRMAELKPYLDASVDRSESAKLNAELVKTYEDIKGEIAAGRMTEEEGQRIVDKKKADMAAEYAEYTTGRAGRREKVAEALRGQKPELIDYLGAMAEGGPGKTLAETLSRAIPGTTKLRMEQKAREMAAAKFMAEAEELDAKADLAERRGQTKEAEAFRDKAEDRKLKSAQTNISMLQAGQGGIKAALEQARAGETEEGRRLSTAAQAATNVQGSQIAADTQRDVARFNAENQRRLAEYQIANRERSPYLQMIDMLTSTGMDKTAAIGFVLGKGSSEGLPSGVMSKIAEDVIGKYSNPHDPRVISAVEKLDANAAKILRLGEKEARNQPGYAAALDIVERAKRQELLSSLGKSQSYTSLPAPPSR